MASGLIGGPISAALRNDSKNFWPKKRVNARKLSQLEQQFLPAVLEIEATPPAPAHHWVLWIIVTLTVTLIAWSCIGEIAVVATAPGKIIPDGKAQVLQPMESGMVRAIHIKEGQPLKQEDLIAELDPTLSSTDFVGIDKTNPEIALLMGVSENTIKHHVSCILLKTALPN